MRKIEKIRYEIDPLNRLIFKKGGAGFRYVVDSTFRIDKNNLLTCQLKSSPYPSIPRQLKLCGEWSLDKKHNLTLTLNKTQDKLILKSEIIATRADALVFSVSTRDSYGKTHLYTLQLEGRWHADKHNRLSFLVKKQKDSYDTLTLTGSWEVNAQNQLIYTYTKTALKTKKKITQAITFKGFWDITEKYRISYALNEELNSGFDFRVSLGKPLKRGLQYEIGIGAAPLKKKITLFGSWKINKKLGLLFEMPCEEGRLRSIVFEAACSLGSGYNLNLRLKNPRHEDLGINLKLSKTLFKNQGEAFLEALKEGKEISLLAGAGFRW
ncbi:MAG: hypothetical protein PHC54_07370 [Candidatus Omnitrophica bacterium]|nr:hypothetical protein [Candidatus Omnitrophota bacterium]MDD5593087.1 hypothetical protein [Candidatus Omnitrophota bacterium]